ncbi:MAG: lactate racemase domain-containing protein [Mycobacteriales bacterium]|nr:MAG: transcriptional regulator [Pseudonocardiales bacterium]
MSRPGFVLEVDERTPPVLIHRGEGFGVERFPLGTHVVYPPDSLPAVRDIDAAIALALQHPHGTDPLRELLTPSTRLTVVIDDICTPAPSMRAPDIRQRVVEAVLEIAAEQQVDDVELVAANGLQRRMTAAELRHLVGERVYGSFTPDRLHNHDAEDRANLVGIGATDAGHDVEINRRVAESDLVVHVSVVTSAIAGNCRSLAARIASYATVRDENAYATAHPGSDDAPAADRLGVVLERQVPIFVVEATLDHGDSARQLAFLGKREWEWSLRDQAAYVGVKRLNDLGPGRVRHRIWQHAQASYGVTAVCAGRPAEVRARTLETLHRQQLTEVDGQSDVVVFGLPSASASSVNSIMNPILAMSLGLGVYFNSFRGRPLLRPGGALILYHPMQQQFHPVHHPSYIDFFEEVLAETTDPATIASKYQDQFAGDEWYRHLYRNSYAFHGAHPFLMWYLGARALAHAGDIICVGADRPTASRLGFRTASTLADALEMASGKVGRSPSIAYLHGAPNTIADVR